jgi:hypothetical protein
MNDKELIELAAKAVGVCLHPKDQLSHSYGNWGCDTWCGVCGEDPIHAHWDPLESDRDALRLAVKLRIIVTFSAATDKPCVICCQRLGPHSIEEEGADPCAAVRRAIVRAAAEIGSKMK